MRRHAGWGILALVTVACAPPAGPNAMAWTVEDFLANSPAMAEFGGWRANELVTLTGEPIPFRSSPHAAAETRQGPGYGLTVFPAFSDGQPAAFVITEIWLEHPTPWVQPAWIAVSEFLPGFPPSAQVPGTQSVFPVGVDSTFYTPFWRGTYVLAPGAKKDTFKSAAAILEARLPTQEGSVLFCPIAPADGGAAVAAGETDPVHPWLLAADVGVDGGAMPVRQFGTSSAWVDGDEVAYLGGGEDRVLEADQLPVEAPLYTFASRGADGGLAILSIPAVLPPDPFRSSFVRRTDVELPASGAVFVPGDRPALAAALAARGVAVVSPDVDPSSARVRLGAVIADARCLAPDAGFSGCAFLDSASAIERLNRGLVHRTETTLAIDVVQVGGRTQR
ncbi:MAG: hypothetical protein AB1730_23940 [Myxococcota bacterium]